MPAAGSRSASRWHAAVRCAARAVVAAAAGQAIEARGTDAGSSVIAGVSFGDADERLPMGITSRRSVAADAAMNDRRMMMRMARAIMSCHTTSVMLTCGGRPNVAISTIAPPQQGQMSRDRPVSNA